MADFLTIDGTPVKVILDDGVTSGIENFRDQDRNAAGTLMIQYGADVTADKETLSVVTPPLPLAERNTLLGILRASGWRTVAGEILGGGSRICLAVVKAVTPITLGVGRRWIISFDLIEQ